MAKPSYEYSGVCYVATAGQTTFALTTTGGNAIGYLKPEHIKVRKSDDAGNTWNSLVLDTDWVFADPATSIILSTGATDGDWIDIHRETPVTKDYIEFQDGDLLTAGQLNDFDDWQLYIDQEILDRVENLTAPDIKLADTDDLPEGSVNLYYTDARVESYVSGAGYIKDAGVTKLKAGSNIVLDPSSGVGEVTINSTGGGGGSGVVYKGLIDATQPAPVATNGDLWVNTATSGVVGSGWTGIVGDSLTGYERLLYDGTNWSLIPSPSGFIPTLQEVTGEGNNTTNDITLSTDKIVLNASNGSATFSSTLSISPGNNEQISLNNSPSGGVVYVRDDSKGIKITLDGSDGTAEFVGGNTEINSYGQFVTTRTDSDTYPAITINAVGTTNDNVNLYGDGRATFKGKITTAGLRIDELTPIASDSP